MSTSNLLVHVCNCKQTEASRAVGSRPPEDIVLPGEGPAKLDFGVGPVTVASDSESGAPSEFQKLAAARWNRITGNDIENIPFGVAVAWAAVFTIRIGPTEYRANMHCAFVVLFAFFRLMHTICFVCGKQPFRTLSFGLGFFCVGGMILNAFVHASNLEEDDYL